MATHPAIPRSSDRIRRAGATPAGKEPRTLARNRFWSMLGKSGRWLLGALILLALLRLALFHGPVLPPEPLPEGPIVDLHAHAAGIGAGGSGCHVAPELRASLKFDTYLAAFGVAAGDLEREGDGLVVARLAESVRAARHVDRAVVLALDGVVGDDGVLDLGRTEVYVPDEFVAAEVARHADVLLFGASVHPHRPDALERLAWAKEHGAVLVKWLPSIQHVDPADERHVPYYRRLVELDLPLLTHTGEERAFLHADDALADPERLRLPLTLGVRVVAAHAATKGETAGEADFARLLRLAGEFDRLWVDVSSLTQVNKHGHLDRVLREPALAGRLLYGSDHPLTATALVSPWYFPLHLELGRMRALAAVANPFDRDVLLKQALGLPAGAFAATARFLGVEQAR